MAHAVDREAPRELVDRQQLVAVRPATSRSAPDSSPAPPADSPSTGTRPPRSRRGASTAGCDPAPSPARDARSRRREAERLVQQQLPRRIRDVILAADHMGDLHQRIVDHHGEVVGGMPSARTMTGSPMTSVWKRTSPRTASSKTTSRPSGTRNRIAGRSPAAMRAAPARAKGGGRCPRSAPGVQPRAPPGVRRRAVRSSRSSNRRARRRAAPSRRTGTGAAARTGGTVRAGRRYRALRPIRARASEGREDRRLGFARRSLDVGVLDAEDERAALAARKQPVEQRRARVADVELAGRAGCESDTHDVVEV